MCCLTVNLQPLERRKNPTFAGELGVANTGRLGEASLPAGMTQLLGSGGRFGIHQSHVLSNGEFAALEAAQKFEVLR